MNDIKSILRRSKTIAIVGLSDNPERDSYGIARVLQKSGYRIIPVNPLIRESLGEKSYPDLKSIPFGIDIVNVFRRSAHVPPIIDEALSLGVPAIWLQSGITVDDAIAEKVEKAGVMLVQDRCISVAHRFSIARGGEV
jgi:uncharacterized protein